MQTVFVVLLVLLMIASMVGVSVGIDNSVQKEGEDISVKTGTGLVSLLLLAFSSITLAIMIRSTAIVTMWGWFVSPVFNIPAPTKALAYGLAMFFCLFHAPSRATKRATKSEYITAWITPIMLSLTILGTGWIIQRFFM